MKNKINLLLISIIILLFTGCTSNTLNNSTTTNNLNQKPTIVTTFYPIHEITKQITQNTANVKILIPSGTEPHSFEPTPKQIIELSNSDIFITMGGMFHKIEEKITQSNTKIKIIQSTKTIEQKEPEHTEHSQENHNQENIEFDPHIWLSIQNMKKMTNQISEELIKTYPQNKELYKTNTQNYLQKLEQLENKYKTQLNSCKKHTILVNHKAFSYLAHEYNFTQLSISGFNPESEPSPKTLKKVIDTAKQNNLKYIFSEGQMDPKVSKTLATEIGGQILELNPILKNENNYIEQMENNLKNLKTGLECK